MAPMGKGELRTVLPCFDLLSGQLRVISVDRGRHGIVRGEQAMRVSFVAEVSLVASDSLHGVSVGVPWRGRFNERLEKKIRTKGQDTLLHRVRTRQVEAVIVSETVRTKQ